MKFVTVTAKNYDTIILQAVYNLLQAVYNLFYHEDSKFTCYTFVKFKVIRTDVKGLNSIKINADTQIYSGKCFNIYVNL